MTIEDRSTLHRRLGLPGTAEPMDIAAAHRDHVARQTTAGEFDVAGLAITAPPGVYHPAEGASTRFFIEALLRLSIPSEAPVLEIGTGSGAIAMALADHFDRPIDACDVSDNAVAAARNNVARNRDRMRGSVTVVASDLFAAFAGRRHGLVVFNNPLIDAAFDEGIDRQSLSDPGGRILDRYLADGAAHLADDGALVFGLCPNSALEVLARHPYDYRVLAAEPFPDGFWRAVIAATLPR